jgi:biotin carboxylase
VRAVAALPGVRLGIVSQEPPEKLPEDLRRAVRAHVQVKDALSAEELGEAVLTIAGELDGEVDRLLGILEQMQVPLAQVRERLRIRGMDVQEARNFRDKARMKDVLRAAGLPCARHYLATDAARAREFARETGFPLVVKPPAGAGARNTVRVDDEHELSGYLKTLPPSIEQPVLLEEFITGREHSFDSIHLDGRHLFHSISVYEPSPLEVLQSPWIQWTVLLPRRIDGPEYRDMAEVGRRALRALGMVTGMTHMEWFRRPDGSLAISEVAARPPGAQFTSLISWAHDLDFYAAWARLMVYEEFTPPERRFAVGAAFLRGQRARPDQGSGSAEGGGTVTGVQGLEAARAELSELVVESRLPKPGQAPSGSYEGEGYVILRHPETELVRAGLRRVLELVRVNLG